MKGLSSKVKQKKEKVPLETTLNVDGKFKNRPHQIEQTFYKLLSITSHILSMSTKGLKFFHGPDVIKLQKKK